MFQNSVLNKYLSDLDLPKVKYYYLAFQKHFNNPTISKNIKNLNETEYQEGFLRDLFVDILGYTLKPSPNFNLIREKENLIDSKRADGAIIKDNQVVAVIELKGPKLKELSKIDDQAFNYKNSHKNCNYVITSNFQKLRFYINNKTEYLEFDFHNIDFNQFQILWLCLEKDSLFNDQPLKIKNKSLAKDEEITKSFYLDYKNFRNQLFNNIVTNNREYHKLLLFKKTQKLLDRFLFIFFAEDKNLLPPNASQNIINKWRDNKDFGYTKTLYDDFKLYFNLINNGRPKGEIYDEIPAFNGGLFAPDEILDSLKIFNDILLTHTQKLNTYNFASEVSVNILGHIFENSLTEIEEIKNELQGKEINKKDSKRRKEGIYYTPKYITKYIVDNTVGKLCREKKQVLKINEEDFHPDVNKATKEKLQKKLDNYLEWLKKLTICDPACGSGAFLNQALEFLITENEFIKDLYAQIKIGLLFDNIEEQVLENNLFGVDINEESIEIAKLSLWLRTARKGRKLIALTKNIKCGNSLIDNPKYAGDKAFNWQHEFPQIFEKGGFDVVIGNPPYVQLQKIKTISDSLKASKFQTFEATGDLYSLFYEKGFLILKPKGLLGFITSNKWMRSGYGASLRKFLSENTNIYTLIDLGGNAFENVTVDSNILLFKKEKICEQNIEALDLSKENNLFDIHKFESYKVNIKANAHQKWIISSYTKQSIINKIEENGIILKHWNVEIHRGIVTGYNKAFIINKSIKERLIKEDSQSEEIIKPILRGKDIKRYSAQYGNQYLIATHNGYKNVSKIDINSYQAIKRHLNQFKTILEKRYDQGDTPYNLRGCEYWLDFEKEKIIYPQIGININFYLSDIPYYCNDKIYMITATDESVNLKYLIAILNSKLFQIYLSSIFNVGGGKGEKFFKNIKIPMILKEKQIPFIEKVKIMMELYKELLQLCNGFLRTLQADFSQLNNIGNNLTEWYLLDFPNFIRELEKNKCQLTLYQKNQWGEFFADQKEEGIKIKSKIEQTDKQIDQMVYKLYGLSKPEIEYIEQN